MSNNPIIEATTRRCIEEQTEAAGCHVLVKRYLDKEMFGRATQEQREAAYHAAQARTRLFRLIGAE